MDPYGVYKAPASVVSRLGVFPVVKTSFRALARSSSFGFELTLGTHESLPTTVSAEISISTGHRVSSHALALPTFDPSDRDSVNKIFTQTA